MTAWTISNWAGSATSCETSAVGDAAKVVRLMTAKTKVHLKSDASARSSKALNDLMDMANEYGIDAKTSPEFLRAKQFLLAIPSEIPAPDLAVDRDGEVVFDWTNARKEMLSVSLRADGRISYAVLRSLVDRDHGTKWFVGTIPAAIVSMAREISSRG